jgi:hypothetical protein
MAKGTKGPISSPVRKVMSGNINSATTGAVRGSEPGYPAASKSSQIPLAIVKINRGGK